MFLLDLKDEGYIGEKTQRYDSVFMGISIEVVGHLTSQEILLLTEAVVARAQRREGAATRVDIAGTFLFENGDTPSLVIPDVFFEGIPLSVGARDEYVEYTLSGKASGYELIT